MNAASPKAAQIRNEEDPAGATPLDAPRMHCIVAPAPTTRVCRSGYDHSEVIINNHTLAYEPAALEVLPTDSNTTVRAMLGSSCTTLVIAPMERRGDQS